jgi:hypothetical protein
LTLNLFRRLERTGIKASHQSNSPAYLPKALKTAGLLDELTVREVQIGMSELIKTGRLVVATVGMYSNRTEKLGLVERTITCQNRNKVCTKPLWITAQSCSKPRNFEFWVGCICPLKGAIHPHPARTLSKKAETLSRH